MNAALIVQEKDGVLTLENDLGCRLQFYSDGEFWGLGTFYYQGKKAGNTWTCFAREETVMTQYRAQTYCIVENTSERGSVQFSGIDGKLQLDIVITLSRGCFCFEMEYIIDPLHPVFHPLYIAAPFDAKSLEFMKFPYEDTVRPDCPHRLSYIPDQARVPLMFGCEKLDGESVFISVGYHLDDPFTNGRFEYDPSAETPLVIFTPFPGMARAIDLQCVTKLEQLRADLKQAQESAIKRFRCLISIAGSQFDCIRGYIEKCGYRDDVRMEHCIDQSTQALYALYKDCKGYVPGKGYHQLIRFDTGDHDTTVPHGWYSKYIVTGPQILLAYELYRYWESHPKETWARERAFEMADFLIEMQEPNGMFTNWDTDQNGISIMHPNDVEGTEFNKCIYSISDMCLGLYHLSMLYCEVKRFEGVDKPSWQNGISLALSYIAKLVGSDGEIGRNYDMFQHYDKLTSSVIEALQMFDDAYNQTGEDIYACARDRLEAWLYNSFIAVNDWSNGSVDGGAWQGGGWPPPHNNDLMGVFTFASYCVERYRTGGNRNYIQMAKDAVAYIWTSVTPIDLEGFSRRTRSLVREQDFYSIYGVLVRGNDSIEALPYLSKITGDPFFMQFYSIILQTQMDYQAFDRPYAGFHIGLECDDTGRNPIDTIAEGNNGYIVRFASEFLKSVTSPLAYRYVGGKGWGLGADYHLAFDPSRLEHSPYVLCATTMVRNQLWDDEKKELYILLYDPSGIQGELEIRFDSKLYEPSHIAIEMQGEPIHNDLMQILSDMIKLTYSHTTPSIAIKVRF